MFAVFHYTGKLNSTAQNRVDYYTRTYNTPCEITTAEHIVVNDQEAIVCIPLDEKARHVLNNTVTDTIWYGIDANDRSLGLDACYFSSRYKSSKSLDNACRIMAAACKSWDIDHWKHMFGHQDIQPCQSDPGNLLQACGFASTQMSIITHRVAHYL
ncbi:peptidoglycan recognition protein family protein [Staphylococcus sp. SQ8-PEA]|uniref:Peptidoglycan recognition protein family protein n=1 Tax=Staphylococcus marylandisciuri TaxID=2981529 RepID=A0ABT2QPW6_9STAP|nr:peptidoglycan recognition family protein [Staphylococcus marylandisciuri]MCU5746019.1 peptidoglycan recognition protein family protein [Staphylococcus marylandisciuri]